MKRAIKEDKMKKIDYDGVLQLEIPEQDDFNVT